MPSPAAAGPDKLALSLFQIGLALALLWIVGAGGAAFVLIGAERLGALSAAEAAALAGAVLLPALMALFCAAAARDSALARAEAGRLAAAAERLLDPERSAEEAARQLAKNVRAEIAGLDRALEQTLAQLGRLQGEIGAQRQAVDAVSERAKAGGQQMIVGMERERDELLRIAADLNSQAQSIGAAISRHTQSVGEAATKAETQVRAADQALDSRLTSFGAAAALIGDRTAGLVAAAQASADSALRLETALSNALDMLAKSSSFTDAARQSADAAAAAAAATAGAVRDTTYRAIEDAKRAADLIRGEAAHTERETAVALERLREAADAARLAAAGARAAAEDRYDPPGRREMREPPRAPRPAIDMGRSDEPAAGNWTWRDLVGAAEKGDAHEAADPVAHLRRRVAAPGGASLAIVDTIARAGLQLDEVFSPSGLERIAQRARAGTQVRRRAVRDAAPEAARALSAFLASDADANREAMAFLRSDGARIADLMGRGRAAMNAEATRAFLLIDAAAG